MKNASNQGSNHRRGRGRNVGKRNPNQRGHNCESNGPAGKVRGTPQQVLEKYLSLARDAAVSGEHIDAEAYFQFAEHYHRITSVDGSNSQSGGSQSGNNQPGNPHNNQRNQQQSQQQPAQRQPASQSEQPVILPPAMPTTKSGPVVKAEQSPKIEQSEQPADVPVEAPSETRVVEIQNVDSEVVASDSTDDTGDAGPKPKPKQKKPRKVSGKTTSDKQDSTDKPPIAEAG